VENKYKNLFTGYWEYIVLKTACKTGIFELIQDGFDTSITLAKRGGFDPMVLKDLLNLLEQIGLITKNNDRIELTSDGEIFTENHPKSLKYSCIHWAEEHMTSWQALEYTLKSGRSSFEYIFKKPLFDYLSEDESRVLNYQKAMNEYARDDYESICSIIDFSIYASIIDVGGGLGALIKTVALNNPNTKCILFDKPDVVKHILDSSFQTIGGDFFSEIPKSAEVIIMSRVIHDWDDVKATQILRNAHEALPERGIVYLIENLTDRIENKASLLSLNMHLITKSYERTESEYLKLLQINGFEKIETIQINDLQYAIKGMKI
jgi:C-methyltransferase